MRNATISQVGRRRLARSCARPRPPSSEVRARRKGETEKVALFLLRCQTTDRPTNLVLLGLLGKFSRGFLSPSLPSFVLSLSLDPNSVSPSKTFDKRTLALKAITEGPSLVKRLQAELRGD